MAAAKPNVQSQVLEWLDSPYLSRVAYRVASAYGLPAQDVGDLLQELRLALWMAGPELRVNATWIYHTASHKAADSIARICRSRSAASDAPLLAHPTPRDPDLPHLLRSRADRLPKKLKLYYALRYREGLSQREIAARMGLCRSSVRWLDLRCVRLIRGRARIPASLRG